MYYLCLRISGEKLDFNKLKRQLPFENTHCCKKGECAEGQGIKTEFMEDIWQTKFEFENIAEFQNGMYEFVKELESEAKYINKLSYDNSVSLWVTAYPDETQTNIHISPDIIKILCAMGVDLDISIMNLNAIYDEV